MSEKTNALNMQRVGEAAFKAGWYAACQTIADMCAKAGAHPETVRTFRDLSAEPPNLVVGEGKTPPTHETVMVQTFPRSRPAHLAACSPAGCADGCPFRGEDAATLGAGRGGARDG